jgi:hydrogenase expression/formation protein HypC
MCIAIAAKILEVDEAAHTARAEVAGNVIPVNTRLVKVKAGDYVLVHAGCAIEVVTRDDADEIAALYQEIEELANDH